MVNTRRQRQGGGEVPETPSRQGSQDRPPRSIRSNAATGAVPPSHPDDNPNNGDMPPAPPHNDADRPPPVFPPSPSLSNASFAGPGQRGRQLLSLATPFDREAYMIGLEKLNEHFAQALRQNGVQIPPRKS